jgi:hypothetical protein
MTKESLFWDEYDVATDNDHEDSADCRCTRCNIANRRKVLELVAAHVQRTDTEKS